MRLAQRLRGVSRLFLDTAPVVYFVEANERYAALVDRIFDLVDTGSLTAVTSPITLAECLIAPYRQEHAEQIQLFSRVLTSGPHTTFIPIDWNIAAHAAHLRAHYNLSLPDALQVAIALAAQCDAFLTNDVALKRVTELTIIVLDDLQA